MPVTNGFKEMARSYYGCDGGNAASDLWICALEPTAAKDTITAEDLKALENRSWEHRDFAEPLAAQYNQKMAWLYNNYHDWNETDFDQALVEKRALLHKDGIGFKMNAFPIRFKNRKAKEWSEHLADLTGFGDFEEYVAWTNEHRGEFFYNLVKENSPKVIVCTGKTYREDFMNFFRCDEKTLVEDEENDISYALTNDKKTIVIISKFFGSPTGINSRKKMDAFVAEIKKIEKAVEKKRKPGFFARLFGAK